jgi:hypothetical protein
MIQKVQAPGAESATAQLADKRASALAQKQLQQLASSSPQAALAAQLQAMAKPSADPVMQQNRGNEPGEGRAAGENKTGLPDQLKSGIESLSGISLDNVKVHYNSAQPAQFNALAYAQGNDIHVAPGQERHLPHEAWHVVQQAQGRVQPTRQLKAGVPVNDNAALEAEADAMGARAVAEGAILDTASPYSQASPALQRVHAAGQGTTNAVQMAGHAEDVCLVGAWVVKRADHTEINQYVNHEVPDTAPQFSGPFYTHQAALQFLNQQNEVVTQAKVTKIQTMAVPMQAGGKGFIMLPNATAGMDDPEMRDLKMGKDTVSGTDQKRRGENIFSRTFKILRHNAMDWVSGSHEQGYRDEDQWQTSMTEDNSAPLNDMLEGSTARALVMIRNDLVKFKAWLASTEVVYIGMSLLVVAGGEEGKAVPIDFEHPIWQADDSFGTHREGLQVGVLNLITLVDAHFDNLPDPLPAQLAWQ